jgi:hypothetical protein
MGGTCDVREEPGKQKPRRCRAQELARSSAQENERQKKSGLLDSARFGVRSRTTSATTAGKTSKVRDAFGMRRQTRRVSSEWPVSALRLFARVSRFIRG